MHLGVDGCPDGWIAVWYNDDGYAGSELYENIEELWTEHGDTAETILIDIPIGLREESNKKRPCDDAARGKLGRRGSSVFAVPVREAVHQDTYTDAKETQEELTDGSLGVQSWAIADKIAQLDTFLQETDPDATEILREAHPEVCFWALNHENATAYSKTGQPAAAFWERIEILEAVDTDILEDIREASLGLDAEVSNDDIVDAFVLAFTASSMTDDLQTLPEAGSDGDDGDPTGLPMGMVYATLSD